MPTSRATKICRQRLSEDKCKIYTETAEDGPEQLEIALLKPEFNSLNAEHDALQGKFYVLQPKYEK